jgi:YYY domain-containing protein
LLLVAILVAGAALRFYNVNWDEGTYHIHPDERHTTMVVTRIQWPDSLAAYFDTGHSLLNARNVDMVYFYGTLPLFLTKAVASAGDALQAAYAQTQPDPELYLLEHAAPSSYDRIHLIGRVLSALFDLGTIVLVFFLGRRLFDWRVGLAASFLLAFTVLNIQGSHYFVVDTFLTFFVMLVIWFTLDVAEGRDWRSFVNLGLAMGLTMACKVSVFLLVAVVALGGLVRVRRRLAAGGDRSSEATLSMLGGLVLAAAVALVVFRVAQPYAWAGPNYDGWDSVPEPWGERLRAFQAVPEPIRAVLMPNPQWVADIVSAGAQQTGEADLPWGRQWTERAAWLWPLENMVKWTLGVPLGVTAWLGVILAAVWVVRRWRQARTGADRTGPAGADRWDLVLIPLAWVVLSFGWQGMQYVKSVRYFMPIHPFLAIMAAFLLVSAWDWGRGRWPGFKVAAGALAAVVLVGTLLWALAFIQIYTEPVTRVQATRWIYDNVPPGSVLANEHFDDPLPFNMFGHSAFGGTYQSLDVYEPGNPNRIDQLPLYNEDTPKKLGVLLDALDQADYIIMSSGRLWQSIPRLPMRYPMTTRYYELLFDEKLGFELAAEFHAYPRLFGIEFDDTWAEEQFTVYDHPKVLIYRKTEAYDREQVEALLSEGIEWDEIPQGLNPREVPRWRREQAAQARTQVNRNDLMLGEAQWEQQQAGGTWASIFDRHSLPNRWPTGSWLVLMAVVGLAALPLTVGVLGWLPDRGYLLARPAGVLLLAWLSWILTSLTPLHYSRGTIALALGIVATVSYGSLLLPGQRRRLRELVRGQWRLIAVSELLFLAAFGLFWLIRWANPDLWHAWKGGEKPMDFAYLNAVIKSVEFPPYDPWYAGGYLNYYYFGQVMVGTLIKLIGIVPYVAYNLVLPTWFAMMAGGAFSLTYNFVAGKGSSRRKAVLFGLVGAAFVALLGNLGEVHLLLLKAGEGVLEAFDSTIPGLAGLVRTAIGAVEIVFGGRALPVGLDEWYWNASRAIPAGPYEAVITEFPFFTYLYADLHAHLIAMPLTFLSLAAALALVKRGEAGGAPGWRGVAERLPTLALWAVTLGAMRTTNTWDVPPHLLVALGALAIAQAVQGRSLWRAALSLLWQFGLLFLLGWWLLYQPFWASYGAFYNSLALWPGTRTPVWAYLVVHGLFLFAIASYLLARVVGDWRQDPLMHRLGLTLRYWERSRRLRRAARIVGVRRLPLGMLFWLALLILVAVEIFFVVPGLVEFTRANADAAAEGAFAYRGLGLLALGLPLGLLGLSLLLRPGLPPTRRFWTYLVLLGLAMTLGVELIVIQGDIGRMNTVFKFYLQTWLIWGVAAAAALAWMVPRLRRWRAGRGVWIGLLVVLILFAALYPPLATSAKVRDRFDTSLGPGLDGWHYMETATYWDPIGETYALRWDLEAIEWMIDNVVGTPVVLEGHTPEYRWGARYSINTGLPTVLGWNWHQRQQRAAADQQEIWNRAGDVATIYNAPGIMTIEPLLREYDVRYIVVGPLERAYYDEQGLNKFEYMVDDGTLEVAFDNEGVTIYEVVGLE